MYDLFNHIKYQPNDTNKSTDEYYYDEENDIVIPMIDYESTIDYSIEYRKRRDVVLRAEHLGMLNIRRKVWESEMRVLLHSGVNTKVYMHNNLKDLIEQMLGDFKLENILIEPDYDMLYIKQFAENELNLNFGNQFVIGIIDSGKMNTYFRYNFDIERFKDYPKGRDTIRFSCRCGSIIGDDNSVILGGCSVNG